MAKDTVRTKISQVVDNLEVEKGLIVDDDELTLGGTVLNATGDELDAVVDGAQMSPGKVALGVIYIPSNVADTETITIGADIYEWDRAADGVVAGTALVGHADDTPTNATPVLVAAINASGTEAITAIQISVNEVLLVADAVGVVVTGLSTDMQGANNAVAAATMLTGTAIAQKKVISGARVPNATEVTLGNVHIPLDFVPIAVVVQIRATATGIVLAHDGDIIITGGDNPYITVNNDGAVDFDADDTIHYIATD